MLARLDRPGAFWILFGALGACVGTALLAAAAAHARFDAPLGHAQWFALLGALFAAGGGGVLWRTLSEWRRVARVARDGIDVVAEITARDPLGSPHRDATLWRVRYRYRDPRGRAHEALTFAGPAREALRWKAGQRVRIRIDAQDFASSAWIGVREPPAGDESAKMGA